MQPRSEGCVTAELPAYRELENGAVIFILSVLKGDIIFFYTKLMAPPNELLMFCIQKALCQVARPSLLVTSISTLGTPWPYRHRHAACQPRLQGLRSLGDAALTCTPSIFEVLSHSGKLQLLPRKCLKFLPRFILRPRGIFQGGNTDHKNLHRFLWASF